MIGKVKILPTAWEDLKHIEDWCLLKSGAEAALEAGDGILDTLERLEMFPDMGSLLPDDWLAQQGHRMAVCQKYIAFYRQIRCV